MANIYIGFVLSPGMLPAGDCVFRKEDLPPNQIKMLSDLKALIPFVNDEHEPTLEALEEIYDIIIDIPMERPKVSLYNVNDAMITIRVRNLPRLKNPDDRYSQEDLDAAEFSFTKVTLIEKF